jgi:integrase
MCGNVVLEQENPAGRGEEHDMARAPRAGRRRTNGNGTIWEDTARGRWRGQFYDRDGRRRSVTALTRIAVETKVAEGTRARDTGLLGRLPTETPTLSEWFAEWLGHHQHELSPSTKNAYDLSVRRIERHIGSRPLHLLSARDIKGWMAKERERGLSEGSILNDFRVLRLALKAAIVDNVIKVNPSETVRAPRPVRKAASPLSREESGKVLEAAEKAGARTYALRRINLIYGPRQGEVLALQWSDIDLATGQIRITKAVRRDTGAGRYTKPPKSKSGNRILQMDPQTLAALKAWRKEQTSLRLAANDWDEADWVFTLPTGTLVEADRDHREWKTLLKVAGVREVRLHDARHTAGTSMNELGTDARTIQSVLGHSNVQTALTFYVKPSATLVAAAGQQVANWFDRPPIGEVAH